jgi:phenylacetate-CoA ligase
MSGILNKIYNLSPVHVQNAILTGYCILLDKERYGGKYRNYKAQFNHMQWQSQDELADYQNHRLRRLIEHSYNTVPYYHNLFKRIGLTPIDINNNEDLYKIPVLTRKDIIENFNDLKSKAFKKNELKYGHTSGTTGAPLEVAYDKRVIYATYALMDRQYDWAGVKLGKNGDRIAVVRGNVIVPIERSKPPFWRHNYYHNQLLLSSFHLSKENLPHYFRKLDKFRPVVLDGYPSTLYVLARFLNEYQRTFPVKAVITSSETLYDFQRTEIEKAFKCHVFDYFAAAERVIFATECEHHQGHHISSEYGITEILNNDLQPMGKGSQGILTGTSLHNYGMPLIRYLTNDVSGLKDVQCSCGRNLPLMEDVSTKAEDIIALRDGRMISPSVLTHPFKPMYSIEESQIIQEDYDLVVIKLVPNEKYCDADTNHLITEFAARLGMNVKIKIEKVDSLERTKSGKFKWVVSKVDQGIKVP